MVKIKIVSAECIRLYCDCSLMHEITLTDDGKYEVSTYETKKEEKKNGNPKTEKKDGTSKKKRGFGTIFDIDREERDKPDESDDDDVE